jgi:uncharacterized protein
MLFGLSAYRYNIFNRLPSLKKYIKRVFWISLSIAVLLTAFNMLIAKHNYPFKKYFSSGMMLVLSTMVFIASSVCWLYVAGKLKRFFTSLEYFGKMTLTNYMVQNVISMFIFSGAGLGLYSNMHPAFYIGLAVVVYTLQAFFSKWWLTHYCYGPVEWLWRQLSYARRLPLKKNVPA